jgi:hypothetical protein
MYPNEIRRWTISSHDRLFASPCQLTSWVRRNKRHQWVTNSCPFAMILVLRSPNTNPVTGFTKSPPSPPCRSSLLGSTTQFYAPLRTVGSFIVSDLALECYIKSDTSLNDLWSLSSIWNLSGKQHTSALVLKLRESASEHNATNKKSANIQKYLILSRLVGYIQTGQLLHNLVGSHLQSPFRHVQRIQLGARRLWTSSSKSLWLYRGVKEATEWHLEISTETSHC